MRRFSPRGTDVRVVVTSSSVSAFVARHDGVIRRMIPVRDELDPARLRVEMLGVYKKVLQDVHREIRSIGRIEVLCASPWSVIELRTIHHTRRREFNVQPELVDTMLQTERDRMHKTRHRSKDLGVARDQVSVVDMHVQQFLLNGYVVEYPYGKIARRFELKTMATLMDRDLYKEFVHHGVILCASHDVVVRSVLSQVRDVLYENDQVSGTLLCIGGESSELATLYEGALGEIKFIPYGTHHLMRKIKEVGLVVHAAGAADYLRVHAHENLNDQDSVKFRVLQQVFHDELMGQFHRYLKEVQSSAHVEMPVYVIGEEPVHNAFDFTSADQTLLQDFLGMHAQDGLQIGHVELSDIMYH